MFPNSQAAGLLKTERRDDEEDLAVLLLLPAAAGTSMAHGDVVGTGAVAERCQAGRRPHRSQPRPALPGLLSRAGESGRIGRLAPQGRAPRPSRPGGSRSDGQVEFRMDNHRPLGPWDRLPRRAAQSQPRGRRQRLSADLHGRVPRAEARWPRDHARCPLAGGLSRDDPLLPRPRAGDRRSGNGTGANSRPHGGRPQRHRAPDHQDGATQVFDLLSHPTRPERRLAAEHVRCDV